MVDQELKVGKVLKEDSLLSSQEFRNWRTLSKANSSILQMLTELVQLIDSEDDEDFEEIDDDEAEESKEAAAATTLPVAFAQTLAFAMFD